MHRALQERSLIALRRVLVSAVLSYAIAVFVLSGSGTTRILGAAAALCVAVLLAWRSLVRVAAVERLHPLGRALDVVTTNVALTLVLLEVVLSVYGAATRSVLLARDDINAYRLLPNHDYGRLWTNSSGYPSREFVRARRPGIARVALLGDSFAVGSVRQDVNFASGIERLRPDFEVYNFGVSAIAPKDYRVILETEVLGFSPDIVLVALFVGNDLTDTPVAPGLTLDDHALARFAGRAWRLLEEAIRQRALAAPSPLLLPQLSTPVVPEKGFTLSPERYLEVEIDRLGVSRLSQAAAREEAWARALEQLRAMIDMCRKQGVTYAMAIIPDEFQVNPALLEKLLAIGMIARDDVDLTLPQRRLLDFCRSEDVPCLDLLPYLEGRSDAYLPQDTHWNETGNLIAARALAPWLGSLRDEAGRAGELGVVENRTPVASR